MSRVIFIFNTVQNIIQCQNEDLMLNICKRFSSEINIELNKLHFLYNGGKIDYLLTFNEHANDNDKKDGIMNVLVYQDEDNNNKNIIISKDIICPKCREICLLKIKNYKISFYNCKKNDKLNNILLDEYEYMQKIDQSEIICDDCKSENKSENNNEFFVCLSCNKNICLLCKSEHDQTHEIIEYTQKNYICKMHNENFHSYCKKCKINLCMICESEHGHKEKIIYFGDIIPKKDIIKNQIDELKNKIAKYNERIKEMVEGITKILNKVSKNLEVYYNINNNILENYEKKKRNYYLLNNLNEIINNNYKLLNDINKIINENEIVNLFNNIMKIYNKMNNKYNECTEYNEDNEDSEDNEDNNKKNEIICRYEIKEDSQKIKIFGNEFIKNNKNNFDFFINGKLNNIRDEINNSFWEKNDKIIEIKLLEKNKCTSMKSMFYGCESLISISEESK